MTEAADRDANRALRARFDDVFGQYQRLRSGLDDVRERLTEMRVTVESERGLVQATVDSRGQLADLRLDPAVYRELNPEQLEREILVTARRAAARTTDEVRDMMAAHLPADSPTMGFLRDNDFGTLLGRSDRIMRDADDRDA
jgi:DNA-binding protein YbaB